MASIEDLDSTLRVATKLLESATAYVRDIPLAPVRENVRSIAEALLKVFALRDAIYELRPDLKPAHLKDRSPDPDADRRLTVVLAEAYALSDAGDRLAAIELLTSFSATEGSEPHRNIARGESERLQDQG